MTWFLSDKGIVLSRDWVFVWMVTGVLEISVGEFDHRAREDFVDWLTFAFILFHCSLVRGHADNLNWRNIVVPLFTAGLVTYILSPAAPPWWASQHGYLSFQVRKVIDDLWHHFGIHAARAAFEHDQDFVNPTAAIPSLHAAYPMLMFLSFWSTGKLWVRLLTGAYALLMGVTLVYTGEHYVIDILLGWVYAIG